MRFASALSTHRRWSEALDEVCESVCQSSDAAPDLAMLFISHDHEDGFDSIAGEVCRRTGCKCLLGCTGESIVGTGREVEDGPACRCG